MQYQGSWREELDNYLEDMKTWPPDAHLERLRETGIIDEHGDVTFQLKRWDARFAITGVKHGAGGQRIESFQGFKPIFGIPNGDKIEVPRETVETYLQNDKKVITARWDARLRLWKQTSQVQLSPQGFILCECAADGKDDVGELPEF